MNLKTVAAKVGLAPSTVSAILNDTPAARAIPQATKDRVYRAAAELNYRPNFVARSLRTKRTRIVAVIAPGLARSGVASVVATVQERLHESGYLLVLAVCDDGDRMCAQFQQRGIEGIISIDSDVPTQLSLPVTSVDLAYAAEVSDGPASFVELGDAAAKTVMRQIEIAGSNRRIRLLATATPYALMTTMDVGFPASDLA